MLLEELPRAGFDRLAPADGAFYLYADVGGLTDDSESFVQRILKETGVAITPGVDFDHEEGRHFVRFSYAGPFADMREAARRLRAWMKFGKADFAGFANACQRWLTSQGVLRSAGAHTKQRRRP